MRSSLEIFGAISLAVKGTDVYSADSLDCAAVSSMFRTYCSSSLYTHLTGVHADLCVVFHTAADFASIDDFTPLIQDSYSGSAWVNIIKGWDDGSTVYGWTYYTTGALGTKKGIIAVLPLPKIHRRYLRAGCVPKSSGTFTAATVTAWIEAGPDLPF